MYGSQLEYKLKVIEHCAEKVRIGFGGWKDKFIDIIDNFLDSIDLSGIGGALKELKDALKASIDN